eukprot:TRINITY_DN2794_c0_g1_i2.p1 TRINITY_DN2794_c0_g1~~TRINITY_DN2794_c0_g1_i2.p1  ORF type:complete len:548 (+),score=156.17 TRINITY_DN2794_c0_g1_i2:1116-2759(+)
MHTNQIEDKGAEALLNALKQSTCIEQVALERGNRITPPLMEQINAILKSNRSIRDIAAEVGMAIDDDVSASDDTANSGSHVTTPRGRRKAPHSAAPDASAIDDTSDTTSTLTTPSAHSTVDSQDGSALVREAQAAVSAAATPLSRSATPSSQRSIPVPPSKGHKEAKPPKPKELPQPPARVPTPTPVVQVPKVDVKQPAHDDESHHDADVAPNSARLGELSVAESRKTSNSVSEQTTQSSSPLSSGMPTRPATPPFMESASAQMHRGSAAETMSPSAIESRRPSIMSAGSHAAAGDAPALTPMSRPHSRQSQMSKVSTVSSQQQRAPSATESRRPSMMSAGSHAAAGDALTPALTPMSRPHSRQSQMSKVSTVSSQQQRAPSATESRRPSMMSAGSHAAAGDAMTPLSRPHSRASKMSKVSTASSQQQRLKPIAASPARRKSEASAASAQVVTEDDDDLPPASGGFAAAIAAAALRRRATVSSADISTPRSVTNSPIAIMPTTPVTPRPMSGDNVKSAASPRVGRSPRSAAPMFSPDIAAMANDGQS